MTRTSLVLTAALAHELSSLAELTHETGAVVLAHLVPSDSGSLRLLAFRVIEVPEDAYVRRTEHELLIGSSGYVPALAVAEEEGAVPIWFHTHPGDGADPAMSRHDRKVNQDLTDLFRLRGNAPYYGALVISPRAGGFAFSGLLDDGESERLIDRIVVVGDRVQLAWHTSDVGDEEVSDLFDRNVRAFGGQVQRAISDLDIAIVGVGGTGSAVAEQLTRLGARHLLLIDPDELSLTNTTRVYGSTPANVGIPKVEVIAEHLRKIAPDTKIRTIRGTITDPLVARKLCDVDLAFGCTDDNAGRMVLSRLATYMLVPVIDCGVLLSSDSDGTLTGIDGRITVVAPGTPCLLCRGRIDLRRAAAERMTADEHARLAGEGYAPALAGVEPAVVAYTTAVAAFAVNELLERLIGFGPDPVPSEVLLRIHEREVSTNRGISKPGHYCIDPTKRGLGLTDLLLETTWS